MIVQNLSTLIFIIFGYIVSSFVGKQFMKVRMPLALGVLISGLALSPFTLGKLSEVYLRISTFSISTTLFKTIQFVGLLGIGILLGFSLKDSVLKVLGKKILVMTLIDIVVSATFVALPLYFFIGVELHISLLIGIISVSIMPAIAISILNEHKAKGIIAVLSMPFATINAVLSIIGIYLMIFLTFKHFSITSVPGYYILIMCVLSIFAGYLFSYVIRQATKLFKKRKTRQGVFVLLSMIFIFGLINFNNYFSYTLLMPLMVGVTVGRDIINKGEVTEVIVNDLRPLIMHFVIINVFTVGININITLLTHLKGPLLFGAIIYLLGRIFGKLIGVKVGSYLAGLDTPVGDNLGYLLLGHSAFASFFVYYVNSEISRSGSNVFAYGQIGIGELLSMLIIGAAIINDILAAILGPRALKGDLDFKIDQNYQLNLNYKN